MKIIKVLIILITLPITTQNVLADYKAGKDKSQVCAGCHGVDGNSQVSMYPRLAGQHKDYLEFVFKRI